MWRSATSLGRTDDQNISIVIGVTRLVRQLPEHVSPLSSAKGFENCQTSVGFNADEERFEIRANIDNFKTMTALEEQILKLPKLQKISIMERIWNDLSKDEENLELPSWHADELKATQKRLEAGEEHFEDWSVVKQRLRDA